MSSALAAGSLSTQWLILPFARKAEASCQASESLAVTIDAARLSGLPGIASGPEPFLFAVWLILLWRYSEQSQVVVGSVGTSGKVFPVAVSFSEDTSFAEVVEQVIGSKPRTDELEHSPDGRPNIAFAFENAVATGNERNPASPFQLLLRIQTDLRTWNAELVYDPACFDHEAVSRMGRSYAAMLSGLTAEPHLRADRLPLLSAQDYEQVVTGFNQTAVSYPDKCVHELFEEQVKRTPQNIALRFRDQTFSYYELNVRSNQLAHCLRQRGVGPNVPVALFAERSAEMIIGLLAILKAGGCYVPLAHDDPEARIAALLAQIQAPVLLTTHKLAPGLSSYSGDVVLFDETHEAEPADNPPNCTKASDLVCVIYTSGSTGVPKGVAARHSNLANYCHFICERLGHPEGWHFATVSIIGAILGNTSVFGALMSGGCLHVIDYETAMSPQAFADYLAEHAIDVLKMTPSQLSSLLAGAEGRCILPRRYLVVGGEKFTWDLLEQIRGNGHCKVMNHFGPTETMGCSTFLIDKDAFFPGWKPASVPLGRPMSNQRLYIVDRYLRPVPIGVPGELSMSGAGLTDGYFHQPQLTAEKFVPNPFEPSTRLYRTGDKARFLPDGNIEFLGRIDHQVKIRGFRVEPGEVEAVIMRYPHITQAVTVPEDGPRGEKILAAYVLGSEHIDGGELRSFLHRHLPDYMIPPRIVMLDSLPLNRNGKVDLNALARLENSEQTAASNRCAPRSATEEKLAEIWAEVLERGNIGIHDNFFELGGHSLLAIQIISRVRNAFRVQFPLFTFLENPTIAALASKMRELPRVETEEEETERLLRELDAMSEEEANKLLSAEEGSGKAPGSPAE
ncbi:MAG: amino acid adenylation domain-containing protein [Acidobacteria bacterium]|nr:amino acid adenylation domain-containing protein [Acidobacteriota bacterium]